TATNSTVPSDVSSGTGSLLIGAACTAASVTTQPTSQTVTYPSDATFIAAGSGSPAPTVQWQVSTDGTTFNPVSGATSTTLTVTKPPVSANGNKYRAVFTNSCGGTKTATTTVASLTVNPKTVFG